MTLEKTKRGLSQIYFRHKNEDTGEREIRVFEDMSEKAQKAQLAKHDIKAMQHLLKGLHETIVHIAKTHLDKDNSLISEETLNRVNYAFNGILKLTTKEELDFLALKTAKTINELGEKEDLMHSWEDDSKEKNV